MFYYAQVDNTDRTQTFRATSKYAVVFKTDDGELRVCFQHHNIEKFILKKRSLTNVKCSRVRANYYWQNKIIAKKMAISPEHLVN